MLSLGCSLMCVDGWEIIKGRESVGWDRSFGWDKRERTRIRSLAIILWNLSGCSGRETSLFRMVA